MHPATASRALDPARPGRVAPATVRRVRAAAVTLGYRPDPAARSLRTRRSGIVGVVVPDLTNPVVPPIVRGIERILWRAGLACVLADTGEDLQREAELIGELRARRCEGLIVAPAARSSPGLDSIDIPTVLVLRGIDGGTLPLVAANDERGVRAAVAHLRGLGHKRIGHVTGPPSMSTTVRRLRAFQALTDGPAVLGEAFTVDAGALAAARLLRRHPGTTAIIAGCDTVALGCYVAISAAALRCPDDVSVVGFNDIPLVDKVQPPLTTVAVPHYDLGQQAARTLLARMRRDPAGSALLPARLVVRDSTRAP